MPIGTKPGGGASPTIAVAGASVTGNTQPLFAFPVMVVSLLDGAAAGAGDWTASVESAPAALIELALHNAATEACEPKMLNATIGLSEWIGACDTPAVNGTEAGASSAEANAGLAQSAIATPKLVTVLDTPLSIKSLLTEKWSHR